MTKQRWEEWGKRREQEKRSEKGKSRKKEDAGARKGKKVAKRFFFRFFGGSKSRPAKSGGAEPVGQVRDEHVHMPVWREEDLEVQKLKAPHTRTTFGSSDVQKVHDIVAGSTFGN